MRAEQAVTFSLIEAVDNAIFHAHRRRRELSIRVALTLEKRRAVVEVSDQGTGIPTRFLERDPAILIPGFFATHGRGLMMMKELMHEIRSERGKKQHRLMLIYTW